MPSLSCLCGKPIELSSVPNPQCFEVQWEPKKEAVLEQILDAHRSAGSDSEFEKLASKILILSKPPHPYIVECPLCGRLAVFAHPSDSDVANWYTLDQKSRRRGPSLRHLAGGEITN
jgi:hypothetical protein